MTTAEFLKRPWSAKWHEEGEVFLNDLISNRYGARGRNAIALRCPLLPFDKVPFAGILHKDSP